MFWLLVLSWMFPKIHVDPLSIFFLPFPAQCLAHAIYSKIIHWLNGQEFEQTLGDSEGQGSLMCCSSWGHKEWDMTEWLNWTDIYIYVNHTIQIHCTPLPPVVFIHLFSVSVSFLSWKQVHLNHFSRFYIYVLIYVFVFLFQYHQNCKLCFLSQTQAIK